MPNPMAKAKAREMTTRSDAAKAAKAAPAKKAAAPKLPALPSDLGECADLAYRLREERLAAARVVAAMEEQEKRVIQHIIDNMSKKTTGAAGHVCLAKITKKVIPIVENWDLFYAYLSKKKRFDLVQKRLSEKAIAELWDAKQTVPGVVPFHVVGVSLTKI